ncbi:MAG: hypothetical protein H0U76_28915 [Ktedonobacteraceae bacterium]|nr:hypothetical protein [Ktedonobacteraceae bacterium]
MTMDYRSYQVALSPDLGITPEEFAEAWNEAQRTPEIGDAQLAESKGTQFVEPVLTTILVGIAINVGSSAIYDLIKYAVERAHEKKASQAATSPAHKHTHIEETKKPDGTSILVVDTDE